jgi:predicted hotdog family 3-hydroxylacyl-ACP dehydratase
MRVSIDAVGIMAPGLPDWKATKAVLAGELAYVEAALEPPQAVCLAPAERRRSSPTVRLAISAAEQALGQTSLAPQDMAMVFSSYEAAGVITHQLCEALAGSREVSPTQFHNSVHNAPSGYYSIAMNAKLAATSICRGEWSFAAGLLSAAAQAVADNVPVIYVCYDSPLPSPVCEVMPVIEPTAVALVLTPNASSTGAGNLGYFHQSANRCDCVARMDSARVACKRLCTRFCRAGLVGSFAAERGDGTALTRTRSQGDSMLAELDRQGIAARVPHAGRMCLLDRVLHWDERSLRCAAISHRDADNPLREPAGLSTLAGIEYAAQAAAVHGSLLHGATSPRNGVLAALRNVTATRPWLHQVTEEIEVEVTLLHSDAAGGVFAFARCCRTRKSIERTIRLCMSS